MVTYGLRRTKPQVRVLAPHPLFLFLAILLLSGSSMAVDLQVSSSDIDHYAAAPGSLASSISSSDSLARAGGLFGVDWYYSWLSSAVTSIDGVSMQDRADGVQELATATYRTFQGVEKAIAESSASDPLVLQWLETIYDQLYSSSRSGDEVTKKSVADLLAESQKNTVFGVRYAAGSRRGLTVPDLLADISWNQTQLQYGSGTILNHVGTVSAPGDFTLWAVNRFGFLGLANLLLGDPGHDINGIDGSGKNYVGTRGYWSLADITANGMQGLATLIGGSAAHRENGNYVWLNQSGYAADGEVGLMDMVGEGFLGLSSLLTDAERGETRLSWMYVSPDDGVSGIQSNHNTLFSFLGSVASGIQNPLARLAYVLADLEDIEFKKEEKPNMDAVKDHFFGDGEGAVNPDQIKDLAGISSGIKDSFGGAGSAGDAFQAINDSNSFWFFSQEVADALDTVNSSELASLDDSAPFDGLVQDENGFYSLIDLSPWDVEAYLGG